MTPDQTTAQSDRADPAPLRPVSYVDVTEESGLYFLHVNGATGRKYFPETMGTGAAFFDFDGDGDLDLYLVNGAPLPGYEPTYTPVNQLYHNNGDGTFGIADITAGARDAGYGMGCAVGDIDNDGDRDLFVTNYGPDAFYRNGGGLFEEATAAAGLVDSSWGSSVAFLDYDVDGDLDLYVANYVHYELGFAERLDLVPYVGASTVEIGEALKTYQHPRNFPGAEDRLWRNEGDGTFADVTRSAGLVDTVDTAGRGLGVVAADLDDNGWPDLYVANDAVPNFLYVNNRDGTFRETGARSGVAVGADGQWEAGMGVDAGDFDGDGRFDLVVTNFEQEPVSLYRNTPGGFFPHVSDAAGLGLITLRDLSFGIGFLDYDNDGYQDLFVASGHVLDNIDQLDRSTSWAQQNMLLRNQGPDQGWRFSNVSNSTGPGLQLVHPSRGAAFADYDDDGDVDILVTNSGGRPNLLRNDGGNAGNWLAVRALGRHGRDAVGARIAVSYGGREILREVRAGYSYLCHSDLRLHFGLDTATVADLRIYWPGGAEELVTGIQANQTIVVEEASGRPER